MFCFEHIIYFLFGFKVSEFQSGAFKEQNDFLMPPAPTG